MDKQEITLTSGNATMPLPPYTYQPSFTFPTEQDLRAFVEQCTAKYLDEKLDARVGKALDELAAEMKNKALQPTSRVE